MKRVRSGRVRGFTLVEVVVGLLVLQVGLLAALAVVVLAARTMTRAQTLEATAWRASALRDSLGAVDRITGGSDTTGTVRASWAPTTSGFDILVEAPGVPPFRLSGVGSGR